MFGKRDTTSKDTLAHLTARFWKEQVVMDNLIEYSNFWLEPSYCSTIILYSALFFMWFDGKFSAIGKFGFEQEQ